MNVLMKSAKGVRMYGGGRGYCGMSGWVMERDAGGRGDLKWVEGGLARPMMQSEWVDGMASMARGGGEFGMGIGGRFGQVGDYEVLIKMKASSINALDLMMLEGYGEEAFRLQHDSDDVLILGRDVAGEVVSCGSNVWDIKKGDQVVGVTWPWIQYGTWAEYVKIPELHLVSKPSNVTHEQACALAYSGLTAWNTLFNFTNQHLDPSTLPSSINQLDQKRKIMSLDEWIGGGGRRGAVVHGGGGAVGCIVVQLLRLMGYYVVATGRLRSAKWIERNADYAIVLDGMEKFECDGSYWRGVPLNSMDLVVDCSDSRRVDDVVGFERFAVKLLKPGGDFVTTNGRALRVFDQCMKGKKAEWREFLGSNFFTNNASFICAVSQTVNNFFSAQKLYQPIHGSYQWAYFFPLQHALQTLLHLLSLGMIDQPIAAINPLSEAKNIISNNIISTCNKHGKFVLTHQ